MTLAIVPGHPSAQAGIAEALKVYRSMHPLERFIFYSDSLLPNVEKFRKMNGELRELSSTDLSMCVGDFASGLKDHGVNLMITGTRNKAPWHEREARMAAQGLHRQSVHFNATWSDFDKISGSLHDVPNVLAVIDEYAFDVARRTSQLKVSEIVVVGNPMYDGLSSVREKFESNLAQNKAEARKQFGIPDDAYTVLVFTQPHSIDGVKFGYDEFSFLVDLVQETKRVDAKVTFCITHHPRNIDPVKGNADRLESILEMSGRPVITPPWAEDINTAYSMILASDLVMSMESTMLVTAAYLGKPCISSQPGLSIPDRLATNKMGVTIPVYEKGKVGEVMKTLMETPSAVHGLAPNLASYKTDGKAALRLARLFEEYSRF